MAKIYDRKGKRQLERLVATLPIVQAELDEKRFEVAARAEALLLQHRLEGDATIDVADGDVDKYVILDDEAGKEAALSIEFGRAAGVQVRTDKNGKRYLATVGAMDGLFILSRAANLPKKQRGKVHLD
ncbi:DUF5403 family protein [Streptomyces sp. NPDC001009]